MKMHCTQARKNISLALDSRLQPAAREGLQTHIDACPACRDWQKEQGRLMDLMKAPQAPLQPSAEFYAVLRRKINEPRGQAKFFTFSPFAFRPAMLRTAMVLVLVFSAFFGFLLSNRLDATAVNSAAAVFNQTMNLDAFADLPAESFGAVYDSLLQGGIQ